MKIKHICSQKTWIGGRLVLMRLYIAKVALKRDMQIYKKCKPLILRKVG